MHAFLAAQKMGLSISDVEFDPDRNTALISSNVPLAPQQMNQLAKQVKDDCPMSKFNDMVGRDRVTWAQKK